MGFEVELSIDLDALVSAIPKPSNQPRITASREVVMTHLD